MDTAVKEEKKIPFLKKKGVDIVFRISIVILSASIYSLSIVWFLEPAGLVGIGLSGVGQILNRLFLLADIEIPIGVFTLILNVPLCIYGFMKVSPKFVLYTILSVAVQSLFLMGWVPDIDLGIDPEQDKLFLAIIAGLFCGVGVGIALRYGTSTGGIDILAQAFNLRKNVSIGIFSTIFNIALAVIAGGFMQGNWANTLYTFIFIIILNVLVDKIHTAYNFLRIEIITDKAEEVSDALIKQINRGCSIVDIKGAYTHQNKFDVFMVVSSYELEHAKKVVYEVDSHAFIMVLPVKRIIGMFFRRTII